mmetsp:Transcript_12939/g.27321  ORF Transcript_12939/g.27321 Transcript_12939/m.27321 type:complete len:261 (-) Transcript_12939:566-1348(-)
MHGQRADVLGPAVVEHAGITVVKGTPVVGGARAVYGGLYASVARRSGVVVERLEEVYVSVWVAQHLRHAFLERAQRALRGFALTHAPGSICWRQFPDGYEHGVVQAVSVPVDVDVVRLSSQEAELGGPVQWWCAGVADVGGVCDGRRVGGGRQRRLRRCVCLALCGRFVTTAVVGRTASASATASACTPALRPVWHAPGPACGGLGCFFQVGFHLHGLQRGIRQVGVPVAVRAEPAHEDHQVFRALHFKEMFHGSGHVNV